MTAAIHEQTLWDFASPGAARDFELVTGDLPDRLGQPDSGGLFWSSDGERFMLETPNGPRFLCEAHGRRVVYDPAGGQARDVAAFAFGPLAGALAYQQGRLPLHASALETCGGLALLCGASGAGKSTLAAALARRGAALFADDVVSVDWRARPITATSMSRRLKLDEHSVELAGVGAGEPVRTRVGEDADPRRYADVGAVTVSAARTGTVERLYVLAERDRRPGAPVMELQRLTGVEALAAVRDAVFRRAWGDALAGPGAIHQAAAVIAGAVEVYRFARTGDPARFSATVDRLEAHLRRRAP